MKVRSIFWKSGALLLITGVAAARSLNDPDPESLSALMELSLEELSKVQVSTASKSLESLDDAPNVMYVITAEQIRHRGYKNLKDALRSVPGISVHFMTNIDGAVVRGIKSIESLVFMINGHSINNMTESNLMNGPINLANVERIEVIVGPGSVMYPPETCTAIVNLITKSSLDGNELQLASPVGDYQAASLNVGYQMANGEDNLFLSGTIMQQGGVEGYDPEDPSRGRIASHKVVDKVYPSNQILSTTTINGWFVQYYHLDQDMPYVQQYNDASAQDAHRYDYMDSILARRRIDWSKKFGAQFSVSMDNRRYIRVRETTTSGTVGDNYDLSQRNYKFEAEVHCRRGDHFLQGGLLYQYKQNRHNYTYAWNLQNPQATNSGMNALVDLRNTESQGIYLSDKYRITDRMTLVGAIRFDQDEVLADSNKIIPSPRLAAIYRYSNHQTYKLMYNRATRMPAPWYSTMNALWGKNNPNAQGLGSWATLNTRALDPEVLTAYEAQSITYVGDARLSVAGYYQEMDNFMDWNNPFTNIGDYSGFGVDGQWYLQKDEYGCWVGGSWTKPHLEVTSNIDPTTSSGTLHANSTGDILGVPQFMVNSGIDYNLLDLTITPMLRYEGHNPYARYDGVSQVDEGYVEHNFYVDLSLTLNHLLDGAMSINLTGQNILNNTKEVGIVGSAAVTVPRGPWYLMTVRYSF